MSHEDVILITADGLRYDRLSHCGNDVETTPTLDALAAEGAACQQAIVTGTATRKSFPGILTSSYPLMYGGYAQMTKHRKPLSETFSDRGYTTLGVNANAQLHTRFGWDRGYDVYFDSDETVINNPVGDFDRGDSANDTAEESALSGIFDELRSTVYQTLDHDGLLYRTLESLYRRVDTRTPPYPRAPQLVAKALSFIDRAPDDKPIFLWVHFMETHSPYVPPQEYLDRFGPDSVSLADIWRVNDRLHAEPAALSDQEVDLISQLYNASLRYLDDEIGVLIEGLHERNLWHDANVMFTSDHGEQFREHGGMTHCLEPYEEGAHVPLLAKFGTTKLTDITKVVSTIDIGPTLLEASFDAPEIPTKFHGLSLYHEFQGDDVIADDRVVFCQNTSNTSREIDLNLRITGCRSDEWKFITSRDESLSTKLFHLPSDPGEQENVAADHPDVVSEFTASIDAHYAQDAYTLYDIEGAVGTGQVSDRLEALGYVQE